MLFSIGLLIHMFEYYNKTCFYYTKKFNFFNYISSNILKVQNNERIFAKIIFMSLLVLWIWKQHVHVCVVNLYLSKFKSDHIPSILKTM